MTLKFERWQGAIRSVSLFVAILAITNVETVWQDYHQAKLQATHDFLTPVASLKTKLTSVSGPAHAEQPLQAALRTSLEEVELKDENPFAHLATLEPLQMILSKGVTGFERETFRSPGYQDEEGYDLVSYQVAHADGSKSTIMAYLERGEGKSAPSVPFVVFMIADGEQTTRYFFFRGSNLVQNSQLNPNEAQSLIAQRLNQSIPFLSVSR